MAQRIIAPKFCPNCGHTGMLKPVKTDKHFIDLESATIYVCPRCGRGCTNIITKESLKRTI